MPGRRGFFNFLSDRTAIADPVCTKMEGHHRQHQGTIDISPEETPWKLHDYQVKCHGTCNKDETEAEPSYSVRSTAGASTIHATNYWSPFSSPQLLGPVR
jgi:hypothetical protein